MSGSWIFVNFDLLIESSIAGVVAFWLIIRIGAWLLEQDAHTNRPEGLARKPNVENTQAVVPKTAARKTTKIR